MKRIKHNLDSTTIIWGTILTLGWGFSVGLLNWYSQEDLGSAIFLGLIYSFIHPIVGRISAWLIRLLCLGIDRLYNPDIRWSNWDKKTFLWFAVFWPICTPVMLLITSIGLIYGVLFKTIF